MAFYGTVAALRTELGVDEPTLSTPAAEILLTDASVRVDDLLGARSVLLSGSWEGRKVDVAVQTDHAADRLARATVLLAAAAYRNPEVFNALAYDSVSGPDFSYTLGESGGPAAAAARPAISALNASGLRRLGARMV